MSFVSKPEDDSFDSWFDKWHRTELKPMVQQAGRTDTGLAHPPNNWLGKVARLAVDVTTAVGTPSSSELLARAQRQNFCMASVVRIPYEQGVELTFLGVLGHWHNVTGMALAAQNVGGDAPRASQGASSSNLRKS